MWSVPVPGHSLISGVDSPRPQADQQEVHLKFLLTGLLSGLPLPPFSLRMCPPLTTKNINHYQPLLAVGEYRTCRDRHFSSSFYCWHSNMHTHSKVLVYNLNSHQIEQTWTVDSWLFLGCCLSVPWASSPEYDWPKCFLSITDQELLCKVDYI